MSDVNDWVFNIESNIFTIISTVAKRKLGTKYPNINFTTTDLPSSTTTKFPCVYLHELQGAERGNDLENISINAVDYYMQVEVITNKSPQEVKDVMSVLTDIFKQLHFNINPMPYFQNETTTYRSIMRVSRLICDGDI